MPSVLISGTPQTAAQAERRVPSFPLLVAGTFVFGWLLGLAAVLKMWHVASPPGWLMFSGASYVTLMLAPALGGFLFVRVFGRLAGRGWGGPSLGMFSAGVAGLVAGLWAL